MGFRLDLAAKDLRLALALAAGVGADLPQTRANLAVLDDAVAAGFGTDDESACGRAPPAVVTRGVARPGPGGPGGRPGSSVAMTSCGADCAGNGDEDSGEQPRARGPGR